MEIDIIGYISSNINMMYIITCNVVTYLILNFIEIQNKEKKLKKIWKRVIATVVAIIIGIVEIRVMHHSIDPIFYGIFLQFLSWDYMFKPIMEKAISIWNSDQPLNDDVFE